MKNKIILGVVLVLAYLFISRETVIDKLMDVDFPISVTQESGIQFYDPEHYSTVDMADQPEMGLVSVVYLYKASCKSCQVFDKNLNKLVGLRPDVAVTKIPGPGIGRYKATYMGEKLNVRFLPFIMIFDREGKLVVSDEGEKHEGYDLFYEWLNDEVDRKNVQLKEEWIRKQAS